MPFSSERGISHEPSEAKERFAPREVFHQRFRAFVDGLVELDGVIEKTGFIPTEELARLEERLAENRRFFSSPEAALFEETSNLFRLKHGLFPHFPEASEFLKGRGLRDLSVEFGGPLGVGKTTLAEFLAPQIGAKMVEEAYRENPFLALSYQDPSFMLRTQIRFLLDSLLRGMRGKYLTGRWTQDTSVWSDNFVFMEWRKRRGLVTPEEHATYQKLFGLFADFLIPKPDLLILLRPPSAERLMEGIQLRIAAELEMREFERAVTIEDLEVSCRAVLDAAKILTERYGINVVEIEVDPVKVYLEPDLRYATVHQIRERLGILGELIYPAPEETVEEILDFFAWERGKFFVLHSPSMFTGKTTVLKEIKRRLGERMIVFQPEIALRWRDGTVLTTRDGESVPALTVVSNDIRDIPKIIAEEGIIPENCPVLGIDEAMLFVEYENDPRLVIAPLKWLRDMGFNIAINGLSLNYKGEPFTFMDYLLYWARVDPNVGEREVTTKCAFCERRARVTRLTKDDQIASFDREPIFVGDEEYMPVCGVDHKSCRDRPEGLPLDLMPKPKEEYIRVLTDCGIIGG